MAMHETRGYRKELRIHLEEPIIEREEEGLAEEVSNGALRDGHGPEVAAAEEVGQQVAGVVEQVPLLLLRRRRLLLLVDAGRLAPAQTRKRHGPIDQPLSLAVVLIVLSGTNSNSREFSRRAPPNCRLEPTARSFPWWHSAGNRSSTWRAATRG